MKALILVDIQNDFVPGGSLAVPGGDEVVRIANKLQERFGLVVAAQDWHPPDHGSFADNYVDKNPGDMIELNGVPQVLWPVHCVRDTEGAQLLDSLDKRHIARIFHKGTDPACDSYSGFFDNGRQNATGLGNYLAHKGVSGVYVMGLATDYCVKFTALDARSLDFDTWLIEDGCRGVGLNPGDIESAISQMKEAGVHVIRSNQIE